MAVGHPEPEAFTCEGGSGQMVSGEAIGAGRDLLLCHGLTATRRYVVHGSLYLPRRGYRLITYDARGHGESDPGPDGYGYERLAADLERVVDEETGGDRLLLGGHSMGCHTVAAWALANPDRVAGLMLLSPAYPGGRYGTEADLAVWDRRAEALEERGPEGFADEMAAGTPAGEMYDRIWHLAHQRAGLHVHRQAVAEALRQVPRSRPFAALEDLAAIGVPTLVVGTRDEIDTTHQLAVARAWADTIPGAELVTEGEGQAPLTWQGGKLSRAIADFLDRNDLR